MRALTLVVALAVLGASPALAAKRRAKAGPIKVAVLPFEGRGAGGADLKEALELELELAENAAVVDSGPLERELSKLGPEQRVEPKTLAALMKKRSVDVVVQGARGPGERMADALVVAAYAADGKPHFMKELPLGSEPDVAAAAIGGPLKDALLDWKNQRAVRLPGGGDSEGRVAAGDVLADEDEEDPAPRVVEREKPRRDEGKKPLDFNEPSDEAPDKPAGDPDVDDGASVARDDGPRDGDRPKRSRLDDDAPPDDEDAKKSAVDDEGRLVDEPAADGAPTAGHMLAASASFRGATWQYGYSGTVDLGAGPEPVSTGVSVPFVAGGGLRVDFWPIRWIGVDAEASVGIMRLVLQNKAGGAEIAPGEFVAYQMGGAAALKARYVLAGGLPGLGFGGRLGYRYWGGTTETQTAEPGGAQVTVVPGFAFHAVVAGAEVDVPITIAERLLEIELRLDALPATYYEETPDNPGQSSLALGWAGSLIGRYRVFAGLFIELGVHTQGAIVSYEGQPEKPRNVLAAGNQPVPLAGGDVRNFAVGFELGLGYAF